MTAHPQADAVTGGSDWTVSCACGWQTIRPTLAAGDAAHAQHQADEKRARRSAVR